MRINLDHFTNAAASFPLEFGQTWDRGLWIRCDHDRHTVWDGKSLTTKRSTGGVINTEFRPS